MKIQSRHDLFSSGDKILWLDKWAVTAQEALQAALGIAGDVEARGCTNAPAHGVLLDSNERNLRSILEKTGADPINCCHGRPGNFYV